MNLYNLTTTQQADTLLISFNETPEPIKPTPHKHYDFDGATIEQAVKTIYERDYDYFMRYRREWLSSRKTYPLKKECENDFMKLLTLANYTQLMFGNSLAIDFLKHRLELKCSGCGWEYGKILSPIAISCCPDNQFYFILKPESIVEDETQVKMWSEIELIINSGQPKWSLIINELISKFTIKRNNP